jgi:hypothetical protein
VNAESLLVLFLRPGSEDIDVVSVVDDDVDDDDDGETTGTTDCLDDEYRVDGEDCNDGKDGVANTVLSVVVATMDED